MIKTYEITYHEASVVFEIDHDLLTEEKLHQINSFWCGEKYRIEESGNVLEAVLVMLARTIIILEIETGYNISGIRVEFDYDAGRGVEGWPPICGQHGIKLVKMDTLDFDTCDFDMRELT